MRGVPVEQVMRDMRSQPHLRGLDGDHAPDDRARSDRPAPARRRRSDRARLPLDRQSEGARRERARSTPIGIPAGRRPTARSRRPTREFGDAGQVTCDTSSAPAASSPAPPSTAMARWQAGTEDHGAFLGRIVDIGAELFAISAAVVYAQTRCSEHPERGGRDRGAGRRLLRPGPAPDRAAVPRACGATPTRPTTAWR